MSSHGGEVCFPGGRQDEEDKGDDVVTATREAYEEVGLHPQYVDIIGRMESIESKHSLCVTPIIGLVRPPYKAEPANLTLNADEVEAVFAVPLAYFANPVNCVSKTKIIYGSRKDFVMRTYLFDDVSSGRRFRIWGLTAHIVHAVAELAFEQ
jgi:coenzyme A diphosphatase NUDT7